MNTLVLHVEGMVCGHCEIAIQSAVRKLSGIRKVKASKRKKEVLIEFDTSLTTAREIIHAIDNTGYKVIL